MCSFYRAPLSNVFENGAYVASYYATVIAVRTVITLVRSKRLQIKTEGA